MTHKLILIVFALSSFLNGSAQVKMAEAFRTMPDSIVRLLTNNDRMDLLDFAESKMTAKVTNRLDGKSTLDKLTDNYLHLSVSERSVVEMKLFDMKNGDPVVLVVKTVSGPAKDSVMKLYSADWSQELNLDSFLEQPVIDAYWSKPLEEMSELELQLVRQLDPFLVNVSLSPDNTKVTFNRSFEMLPKVDQPAVEKLLQPVTVELKD